MRGKVIDSDTGYILREAARRVSPWSRRHFLRNALGLGTLSFLGGCDVVDGHAAEGLLSKVSDFNDRVQAWLFNPLLLAPEYPESAITRPFPFNSFYIPNTPAKAPVIDGTNYVLNISGRAERTNDWRIEDLKRLPQFTQITRHVCIEGWSAIGKFTGIRFSDFLRRIRADLNSRYVTFRCDDHYVTSIDMATALHPQTQLTLGFDGAALPREHGYPLKLRVPTKLGFKNPKHIGDIEIGDEFIGGYWETYGYNWFSGL
jgi:DMSO/TMAO reductase YedYZ molybdopterin-dependent catalytic subunit